MPSANKDRIRVTLHVDRKIYELAKVWSEVYQIPVSRLFDKAVYPLVRDFEEYDSYYDYYFGSLTNPDEDKQRNYELQAEQHEIDERRKKEERERITKMAKREGKTYEEKLLELSMRESKRQKQEDDELNERWIKAIEKRKKLANK